MDEITKEITPRMKSFCRELRECKVATVAAIRSGYSEHTASEQASRLMKHPGIIAELERLEAQEEQRRSLSEAFVLAEILEIATDKTNHARDRLAAWIQLGKYKGLRLFSDSLEIESKPIETEEIIHCAEKTD